MPATFNLNNEAISVVFELPGGTAAGPGGGIDAAQALRLVDGAITMHDEDKASHASLILGDDLQSIQVASVPQLVAALAAQSSSDQPLEIHFTDDVRPSGEFFPKGLIAYVPPRSVGIENRFTLTDQNTIPGEITLRQYQIITPPDEPTATSISGARGKYDFDRRNWQPSTSWLAERPATASILPGQQLWVSECKVDFTLQVQESWRAPHREDIPRNEYKGINDYLVDNLDETPFRVYQAATYLPGILDTADLDGDYVAVFRTTGGLDGPARSGVDNVRISVTDKDDVGFQVHQATWSYGGSPSPIVVPFTIDPTEEGNSRLQAAIATTPGRIRFSFGYFDGNVGEGDLFYYDMPINDQLVEAAGGGGGEDTQARRRLTTLENEFVTLESNVQSNRDDLQTQSQVDARVRAIVDPFSTLQVRPEGLAAGAELPATLDLLFSGRNVAKEITGIAATLEGEDLGLVSFVADIATATSASIVFSISEAVKTTVEGGLAFLTEQSLDIVVTFTYADSTTDTMTVSLLVNNALYTPPRELPANPSNDQIARYDSTSGAWLAEDLPAGGGGLNQSAVDARVREVVGAPFLDIELSPGGIPGHDIPASVSQITIKFGGRVEGAKTISSAVLSFAGVTLPRSSTTPISNIATLDSGSLRFNLSSANRDTINSNISSSDTHRRLSLTFTYTDNTTHTHHLTFDANDPSYADPPAPPFSTYQNDVDDRVRAVAGPVIIVSNIASYDASQNRFEDSSGDEVTVPDGSIVTLTQAVYDAAVADSGFTPNANAIFLTR